MELVVDANIVISALLASAGKTCDLLFSEELELLAPEFLLAECNKHKQEILTRSGYTGKDFELAFSLIAHRIQFVPFAEFEKFIARAKRVCPDENDTEYFAVALRFQCPLWSNDKELRKQDVVGIIDTAELLDIVKQKF